MLPIHRTNGFSMKSSIRRLAIAAGAMFAAASVAGGCAVSGHHSSGAAAFAEAEHAAAEQNDVALVIHGGGGVMSRENMTDELEAEYRAALAEALEAGYEVLDTGGSAVDAVEAAILVMEDSPLFNAGKGATFTREGANELDASIMDGRTRDAGGVAGVTNVRNPIKLARIVMEDTPHVLLASNGAELLAREHELELVGPHYFWTERRWEQLQRRLERQVPYGESSRRDGDQGIDDPHHAERFSTVGAAALDRDGNLAAGTSTGGVVGKLPGRVGDSPIIGAGTYADNNTAAVSATGIGEYVMRVLGTKRVCDLMEHRGLSVDEAAEQARQEMEDMGGSISFIALDAQGEISMRYSGRGMYRGFIRQGEEPVVHIYEE